MINNQQAPRSADAAFQKLKLDRQGGACLDAGANQFLRVRQRALRFLHIRAGAELQELDLSRCAPGLDLTIDACPKLRLIRLPPGAPGAVLHLNADGPVQPLEILGMIQSLDARWQGSDFAVDAQATPAFNGARIGSLRPWKNRDYDIVIEQGDTVAESLEFVADPRLRQLIILNATCLRTLHLPHIRALERVQLFDCDQLERIHGTRIHRLELTNCPSLQHIGTSGHAMRLNAGTGAAVGIHIEQPWTHLTMTETPAQALHAEAVGSVLLRDCADLREAHVGDQATVTLSGNTQVALTALSRLRLDEGAVGGLLVQARAGDAKAQRMLEHWCGHARKPWEYLETLRALAAAEADPVYLWQLRCRLHARCNLSQGTVPDDAGCLQYANMHWNWRLPSDRYLEGWEADMVLWLRARNVSPELERMLRLQPPLLAVAALARQLSRGLELTRLLEDQLCRAIRRARNQQQHTNNGIRAVDRLAFELLVSAAASQRSLRMADAILSRLLRDEQQAVRHLNALASLAALGHAGSRVMLMRLAQGKNAEIRARALAMALSPIRNDIFTSPEVAYA